MHFQRYGLVKRANLENTLTTTRFKDNKMKNRSNSSRFENIMKTRTYETKHLSYKSMFGIFLTIYLKSSLFSVNMMAKLKPEDELQVALGPIKVPDNDNDNNEVLKKDD